MQSIPFIPINPCMLIFRSIKKHLEKVDAVVLFLASI